MSKIKISENIYFNCPRQSRIPLLNQSQKLEYLAKTTNILIEFYTTLQPFLSNKDFKRIFLSLGAELPCECLFETWDFFRSDHTGLISLINYINKNDISPDVRIFSLFADFKFKTNKLNIPVIRLLNFINRVFSKYSKQHVLKIKDCINKILSNDMIEQINKKKIKKISVLINTLTSISKKINSEQVIFRKLFKAQEKKIPPQPFTVITSDIWHLDNLELLKIEIIKKLEEMLNNTISYSCNNEEIKNMIKEINKILKNIVLCDKIKETVFQHNYTIMDLAIGIFVSLQEKIPFTPGIVNKPSYFDVSESSCAKFRVPPKENLKINSSGFINSILIEGEFEPQDAFSK